MMDFIYLFAQFIRNIWWTLSEAVIPTGAAGGGTVSVGGILMAAIIIGFAVCVFWKGAKA